jgi:putative salt-induced outer membrane protein
MRNLLLTCLIVVSLAVPAMAQDQPEPVWKGSLGLSYVATSGNSDTSTLGLDFGLTRKPEPWGLEFRATAIRGEQEGNLTAERYLAAFKGTRALGDRWELFGALGVEKDQFAGYDLRTVVGAGATYKALTGPEHTLKLNGGLTWTREDLVEVLTDAGWVDQPSYDYMGGILGLDYAWQISQSSKLSEVLNWFPNFDESGDWRAVSETALQAAISQRLALKLAYLVRYDNEPALQGTDLAGSPIYFDDTDTTTTVSVVVNF